MSLENQINEARKKAELFAARLGQAQRQEEEQAEQADWNWQRPSAEADEQKREHVADPVSCGSGGGGPSVEALELIIRGQQRDLVKAATDLRVSLARTRTLQQRVEEVESALRERDEQLRFLSAAVSHARQTPATATDRDATLHESQMQALKSIEYARSLEMRLDASEARCKDLAQRLAVAEARVRNSFDGVQFDDDYSLAQSREWRLKQWSLELGGGAGVVDDKQEASGGRITRTATGQSTEFLQPPTLIESEPKINTATTVASDAAAVGKKKKKVAGADATTRGSQSSARSLQPAQRLKADATARPVARPGARPASAPLVGRGKSASAAVTTAAQGTSATAAAAAAASKVRRSIKVVVPSSSSSSGGGPPDTRGASASGSGGKGRVGERDREGRAQDLVLNLSADSAEVFAAARKPGLPPRR